jgi:transcriptional regulator
MSPALVSRPHWAPTWNFAVAVFAVTVAFDDPSTMPAVRRLTDHVEAPQERRGGSNRPETACRT